MYLEKLASGPWLPTFLKRHRWLHFITSSISVCVQSCPTLCHPMDYRLLCPWYFSGKNTRVGCHFLCQRISPAQELNPCLLHLLHLQADFFYHLASRFFTIIACWEDPFFDHSKSKVKIRRQLKWSSTYWKTITGKLGCYARQEYLSSKNKVISYLNKIWGSFPPTGIHWKKCRRVERQKERPSV